MRFLLLIILLCRVAIAQTGLASWYGNECRGKLMANGHPFSPDRFTAASWYFPLGTRLTVILSTNETRRVIVTVTDRGPARRLHRMIDLSRAAFAKIADPRLGVVRVKITRAK